MRRYAKKHGCPVAGFSKSSLDALQSHPWPGNIRELQNVVERAVILTGEGALIEPELLGLTVMSSGKIYIPANPMAEAHEADTSATQLKTETLAQSMSRKVQQYRVKVSPEDDDIPTLGEIEKRPYICHPRGV